MNNYGESLLDSMSILFKNTLNKEKITKVVEALIVELIDTSVGLYSINYENQILKAYSNNVAIKYNKDDKVYVLCQNGALDGSLIIIGAKNPYSGLYQNTDDTVKYLPVADSLFTLNDNKVIELCTYQSDMEEDISHDFSYFINDNEEGAKFRNSCNYYLERYKTFCFQFKVRTDITDIYQRVNGDYGIIMRIPLIKDDKTYYQEVNFNTYMMSGNPYEYQSESLQTAYIQIDEGAEFSTEKFQFFKFIKNFIRDISITTSDVFISDIQFYPVEVLSESSLSGQYLRIQATEGNFFAGSAFKTTKTLTPTLLIDGQETSLKGCSIRWYIEDAAITPSSAFDDGYDSWGGAGWRRVKLSDIDFPLEISCEGIKTSITYKAVVNYSNNLVSQTIKIENLDSNVKIKANISSGLVIEGGGDVYLDVDTIYDKGNDKTSEATLTYSFLRYDYQNNFIDSDFYDTVDYNIRTVVGNGNDAITTYHTRIKFDASIVRNGLNTITCSVYEEGSSEEKVLIGTESVGVVTTVNADYILSMQNSDFLYKYDAAGNAPTTDAYNGPLSAIIKETQPIGFKIYKRDGIELNEGEYSACEVTWEFPLNSMMSITSYPEGVERTQSADGRYEVITGKGQFTIPYRISNSYNAKFRDNTVRLTVKCDKEGHIVKGVTNFTFMKDGESGTNGTQYAAFITYTGYKYGEMNEYNIPHKFQLVCGKKKTGQTVEESSHWYRKDPATNFIKTDTVFNGVPLGNDNGFNIKVFSNGEAYNNFSIVEWKLFDSNGLNKPNAYFEVNGTNLISHTLWTDPTKSYACILQGKVSIKPPEGKELQLFVFYPIEISYIEEITTNMPAPVIDDGFDNVFLSNDGTNAEVDGVYDIPFHCITGLYNDDVDDTYDYDWTHSSNSLSFQPYKIPNEKGELEPVESKAWFNINQPYNSDDANNYIRAELRASQSHIDEVTNYINGLTIEINDLTTDIDKKDECQALLSGLSETYDIDTWESIVANSNVLSIRDLLLQDCRNILEALIEYYLIFAREEDDEGNPPPDGPLGSYPYEDLYFERKEALDSAKESVQSLITTGSTITELGGNLTLGFPPVIQSQIVDQFGQAILQQAELAGDRYNEALYGYQAHYAQFNDLSTKDIEISNLHKVYADGSHDPLTPVIAQFYGINEYVYNINLYNDITPPVASLVSLEQEEYTGLKNCLNDLYTQIRHSESQREYLSLIERISKISSSYIKRKGVVSNAMKNKYDTSQETIERNTLDDKKTRANDLLISMNTTYPIVHIKPIIFTLNRYGFAYLNEWDGNKIYVNENGDYILSPLVGAGKKEDDNSYTGLLMGTVKENSTEKIGLLGYSKGVRSIFLDAETGKAEFGASGEGQIIIDPENGGLIYGGGYVPKSSSSEGSGMLINLKAPEIRFGSGNFIVDKDGNATIKGTGDIAGWKIENDTLKSKDKSLTLDSSAPKIYSNAHDKLTETNEGFYLGKDGISIGENFHYEQANNKLTLGSGNKTWTIDVNEVTEEENGQQVKNEYSYFGCNTNALANYKNNSVYIGTDGIRLGKKFKVDKNGEFEVGNLSGRKWKIGTRTYINADNKKVTHSYFWYGGANIDPAFNAAGGTIYIGTDGMSLGQDKFSVTKNGFLTAKNGIIANFHLKTDKLYTGEKDGLNKDDKDGVFIGDDGIALGQGKFKVTETGILTASRGTIGGWNITDTELSSSTTSGNSITISSNGEIIGGRTGSYIWHLKRDGSIEANNIIATGGEIGGFTLGGGALYTNGKYDIDVLGDGVHLSSSGIAIGDTFKVTNEGILTASSGTIGGIILDSTGLKKANGSSGSFSISNTGTITCSNLICSGGSIGGITINSDGISGKNFALYNSTSSTAGTIGGLTINSNGLYTDYAGLYSDGKVRGNHLEATGYGGGADAGKVKCQYVEINNTSTASLILINGEAFTPTTLNYTDENGQPASRRILAKV